MATNTTNYNWKKPDYEDDADIKDLNDNFDGIDAQVKAIDDQVQLNKNNILSLNKYGGGRNLINISAIKSLNTTGTWSGNTYTATTGVEFTVNSDNSITVNGTSSGAATTFMLTSHGAGDTDLSANTYKLSGCEGGSSTTYDLRFYRNSDGTNITNYNGDTNVSYTSGAYNISILVRSGQTLTKKEFNPMLRLSSDESNLYQPYAMSNAELTAAIKSLQAQLANQ